MKKIQMLGLASFLIILLIALSISVNIDSQSTFRKALFAGQWYPAHPRALYDNVKGFLGNVKKMQLNGTVKAIIVPNSGYQFSGQIAAAAYRQIGDYKTVFILGPSQQYKLSNASILNVTYYLTPLGHVRLSDKAKMMRDEDIITTVPQAHLSENSIESQLPFLQVALRDFDIVPILVGDINATRFSTLLERYLDDDDLIVASIDLSHYHDYTTAKELDSATIHRIMELDSEGIIKSDIDAPYAVSALLSLAKRKGWRPEFIYYANSGDISGQKSRVVGYTAIVFAQGYSLSTDEKNYLLDLARETIKSYLTTGKKPEVETTKLTPALKEMQGCFTTLYENNNLRGCIGHIIPQEELYRCVMDNAVNAAVNDPRFNRVQLSELDKIDIEVSVLTVPKVLEHDSADDLLSKLQPLVDGVILKQGMKQSTYLPQVWEQLPDKKIFLSNLCRKGGMPLDCWQDKNTQVYTYQAYVFSESGSD